MYNLEPALRYIDWNSKSVLTLIQSINQPMVAAADYPAEETQAFIVTVQAPDRSLETYIYLHLLESNRCVIYREASAPFMGDRLEEAEGEALDFVESMGFMMDNLRFVKLPEPDRQKIKESLPLFYPDLSIYEPILKQRREQEKKESLEVEGEAQMPQEENRVEIAGSSLSEVEVVTELEEVVDANETSGMFVEAEHPVQSDVSQDVPAVDSEDTEEAVAPESEEDLSAFFEPQAGEPMSELADIEFAQDVGGGASAPESAATDDLSALAEIEESLAKDVHLEEASAPEPLRESPTVAEVPPAAARPIKPEELQAFMRLLLTL